MTKKYSTIIAYSTTIALLFFICACHHAPDAAKPASQAMVTVSPELKKLHFDYDKDPSCGMPLRYGLLDSTVYAGKLYGFCSKECKEAFLKDPKSALAQIK